jgi:hypothetical protein
MNEKVLIFAGLRFFFAGSVYPFGKALSRRLSANCDADQGKPMCCASGVHAEESHETA